MIKILKNKLQMKFIIFLSCVVLILLFSIIFNKEGTLFDNTIPDSAYQITKNISYNGNFADIVIDKPEGNKFDVLMIFHGTVGYDNLIMQAAHDALNGFKNVLDKDDVMLVSVAYPQETLLFGDGIQQGETALLWLQNKAQDELQINIRKIFLAGHSQGGYMVTRLNTMHTTDGVIANAPGPLDLKFRCELEEDGRMQRGQVCMVLQDEYGLPSVNPAPYYKRSLRNYVTGHKSDILFIQGLNDSPTQMNSWSTFKEGLLNCNTCQDIQFLELPNDGHNALFISTKAKTEFNNFINSRR